jgi:hypothetical protein
MEDDFYRVSYLGGIDGYYRDAIFNNQYYLDIAQKRIQNPGIVIKTWPIKNIYDRFKDIVANGDMMQYLNIMFEDFEEFAGLKINHSHSKSDPIQKKLSDDGELAYKGRSQAAKQRIKILSFVSKYFIVCHHVEKVCRKIIFFVGFH